MRIGQLARRSGLTTRTIRYYESIGLLPVPTRLGNGYRDYDQSTLDRLAFLRDAQTAGLSLDELAVVFEMRDRGESTCGHVIGLLRSHLESIDEQLETIVRTRNEMQRLVDRAETLDPARCTDPNRCQTITRHEEDHAHHLAGLFQGGKQ